MCAGWYPLTPLPVGDFRHPTVQGPASSYNHYPYIPIQYSHTLNSPYPNLQEMKPIIMRRFPSPLRIPHSLLASRYIVRRLSPMATISRLTIESRTPSPLKIPQPLLASRCIVRCPPPTTTIWSFTIELRDVFFKASNTKCSFFIRQFGTSTKDNTGWQKFSQEAREGWGGYRRYGWNTHPGKQKKPDKLTIKARVSISRDASAFARKASTKQLFWRLKNKSNQTLGSNEGGPRREDDNALSQLIRFVQNHPLASFVSTVVSVFVIYVCQQYWSKSHQQSINKSRHQLRETKIYQN